MMIKTILTLGVIVGLMSSASGYAANTLYAYETSETVRIGAVFGDIEVPDGSPLVSVKSSLSENAQVHNMTEVGGMVQMRQVAEVPVGADGKIHLTSSGYHVMLIGLKVPLKVGNAVPLTLTFKSGKTMMYAAPVIARGAK